MLIVNALTAVAVFADPVSKPPQLIEQTTPDYSDALRNAGISGQVVVQFGVDATGAVQNVTVFKSDHSELDAPAVEAVKKWRFKPATKDGQPIATPTMRVPISFNIPPSAFQGPSSIDAALKLAEHEHKIVFIDFYTTWCEPCKRLDRETWQDASVIALLKEKAIGIKVDAEKNAALAHLYNVNAYPTLALIRPDGTLIESLVGYRDALTFSGEFTAALEGRTKLVLAKEAVDRAGADPELRAKARYDLGRELANEGRAAEALTEYLWCFDVGMKMPSSYAGVRGSYLLQDIANLGAQYPPALDALKARRDDDEKRLSGDRNAAVDFGSINHCLGADNATLTAFDRLAGNDQAQGALGYWLFDKFIDAKRYRDAAAAVPAASFRAQFDAMRAGSFQVAPMHDYLVNAAAKELEALAGAGKLDDASALLGALLEFDHSEATVGMVHRHLERAGHADLVPSQPVGPTAAPVAPQGAKEPRQTL